MRSIVRRDTGESYEEFLRGLAKASGIATPTREDLAGLDRKRKKRTSNKEWKSPADGDARIAKMNASGNGNTAKSGTQGGESSR
jgi:transposase